MAQFRIYVRAELINDDTGEKVTWDDDTFYVTGDVHKAHEVFGQITDAAGKAAAENTCDSGGVK